MRGWGGRGQAGGVAAARTASQPCCRRRCRLATPALPCSPHCCLCSPMFVLPVFKGPNAFENFMVQCQLPLVLLTTLEEYKT